MSENAVHLVLLGVSISSIAGLFAFKPKRLEHALFAILAASLLLLAISQLLPASFRLEQQFIGLGTFATCNVFWLLSRAIFRKGNALNKGHYLLAGLIAFLILASRSTSIFVSLDWVEQDTIAWLKGSLGELLQLLSSGVILLAFWEAVRNYASSNKRLRKQKILFAGSMFVAVMATRVIAPNIPVPPESSWLLYLWIRSMAASLILVSTFIVLWLQFKERELLRLNAGEAATDEDDEQLDTIQKLMQDDSLFLKPDLKMMDIANTLSVPEYKISKAIREKTHFDNFNQYVNSFRVEFAKKLLTENQDWTVLVIAMESGFASLATFNRVFKSIEGCTPKQYRHSGDSLHNPH